MLLCLLYLTIILDNKITIGICRNYIFFHSRLQCFEYNFINFVSEILDSISYIEEIKYETDLFCHITHLYKKTTLIPQVLRKLSFLNLVKNNEFIFFKLFLDIYISSRNYVTSQIVKALPS